jgi:hypothetical protein
MELNSILKQIQTHQTAISSLYSDLEKNIQYLVEKVNDLENQVKKEKTATDLAQEVLKRFPELDQIPMSLNKLQDIVKHGSKSIFYKDIMSEKVLEMKEEIQQTYPELDISLVENDYNCVKDILENGRNSEHYKKIVEKNEVKKKIIVKRRKKLEPPIEKMD